MKLVKMLAAVVAAGMMAGCAVSAPGYATVTEPAATAVTAPEASTAPAETRYQLGDIVWTLDQRPDGTVDTCRFAVISHDGDVVMITHAVSDSAAALRECLPEYISSGDGEVWAIDAAECYSSEAAAREAAGRNQYGE